MEGIIHKLQSKSNFRKLIGVSDNIICKAESELGLDFSGDFRDYLKEFGMATILGHEFTGLCDSKQFNTVNVTIEERLFNPNVDSDFYVIEKLNVDGTIIWQKKSGEIFLTAPFGKPQKLCNSFCEYIDLF